MPHQLVPLVPLALLTTPQLANADVLLLAPPPYGLGLAGSVFLNELSNSPADVYVKWSNRYDIALGI